MDDSILDDVGNFAGDASACAPVPTACAVVREMDDAKVDAEEFDVQVTIIVPADSLEANQCAGYPLCTC